MNSFKRGHLLFRIFLAYLVTAIFIICFLLFIFKAFQSDRAIPAIAEKNIHKYFSQLQTELFSDLSNKNVKKIEEESGLHVRIAGHEALSNQETLPTLSEINNSEHKVVSDIKFGRVHDYFFLTLKPKINEPQTVWFVSTRDVPRSLSFPFLGIIGFIVFILAISFMSIRWIMKPIKTILNGIEKLSSGDLAFRVDVRHKGEFSLIASTFNTMAERIEKMVTAKDQLLRDVSHELRSPMTRLGVAVDLMPESELKHSMKDDLGRMDLLVNQILESYRIKNGQQHLQLINTNFSELLTQVSDEYKNLAPGFTFSIEENIWLNLDPMQIERVIRNLLENAIKYSQKGSQPIVITLKKNHNTCELSIEDRGIGIAPKDLPHIFEPFYRADTARTPGLNGYGLGLSISKAIVEAHRGQLSVKSTLGVGSEFTIIFTLLHENR